MQDVCAYLIYYERVHRGRTEVHGGIEMYDPLKIYDERYDPSQPPSFYELDAHGYATILKWRGVEAFLKGHPLPEGAEWQWRCNWSRQLRLHRSDDPENEDRYGLENIPSKELSGLRRIE